MSGHGWARLRTLAFATLLASAGLFGSSLRRALVVEPLPGLPAGTTTPPAARMADRAPVPPAVLARAVEADPFHPERRRPAVAFRLPGEPQPGEEAGPSAAPDRGDLRLIGTAVLPEGRSFALCEWPGEAPRLVRLGETLHQWTLRVVEPGRAVFVAAEGATLEVRVPKAGT